MCSRHLLLCHKQCCHSHLVDEHGGLSEIPDLFVFFVEFQRVLVPILKTLTFAYTKPNCVFTSLEGIFDDRLHLPLNVLKALLDILPAILLAVCFFIRVSFPRCLSLAPFA